MNKDILKLMVTMRSVLDYSDLVVDYCRDKKFPETKKLSRKYKEFKVFFNDVENKLPDDIKKDYDTKYNEFKESINQPYDKIKMETTIKIALNHIYLNSDYLVAIKNCLIALMLFDSIVPRSNLTLNLLNSFRQLRVLIDAYIPGNNNIFNEFNEFHRNQLLLIEKSFKRKIDEINI